MASNLVSLRPHGDLTPLFGVHPLSGTVEYLRLLSERLDVRQPVYGLEASGWGANDAASSSMSELAAHYVAQLQRVQTHGPYRLLGYSAGGLIAYAMAEQLSQLGEAVEFLGVIDAPAGLGVAPEFVAAVERMERVERQQGAEAADLVFLRDSVESLVPEEVLSALDAAVRAADLGLMLTLLEQHRLRLIPGDSARDASAARRALRVMRRTKKALCHYRPRPAPLPVTLFVASEADSPARLSSGWRAIVAEQLRSVPVAGTHFSMMERPHIDALAQAITAAMRRACPPVCIQRSR
jgi:syringomycin synthetase protein SyrE